jgi:hypothetical protein
MRALFFAAIIAAVTVSGCKKEDSKPATTTPPATMDGFTWREDGGTEITADSAYWTSWSNGTGVRAFKNGNANFFEINWDVASNTSAGTKTLEAGKGLTFLKGTATYTNTAAEKMNITAFSSDKLSGNFTVKISGGTIKELTGIFTNIPKR